MAKKKIEKPESLDASLKNPNPRAGAVGITDLISQTHRLTASGSGTNWSKATKDITPPPGWRSVFAHIRSFDLGYTGSDHNVIQVGAAVGLSSAGDKIRITVQGIIRDNNADDARKVIVDVGILFTI